MGGVATEGEPTTNYDTGSLQRSSRQPKVSTTIDESVVNTYPSLRRAVAKSLKYVFFNSLLLFPEIFQNLYRKHNAFSNREGAHICINPNKNIEQ